MTSAESGSNSADKLSSNESVQVVVRCRPLSSKEIGEDCKSVVRIYSNRGVIEVENPKARSDNERSKIFTYDAVYDENSTQQALYDETIRPLVASVLEGYNGCVFAYGQTGTGKTYTMEGTDGDNMGIIPRAFEQIWSHIARKTGVEFLVSVRYLEIYMEEIRDLLRIKSTKAHELREQAGEGVVVTNLHSHTCQSAKDMLKAMKSGNHNRTTGATNMNEHSSRSHAIFQIIIEMVEGDSKSMKVGKLNLVDLAGSERQSKTGATGDRLKEATKINKALSSLGNVIYALAENSAHIPYRDSKLTRLLQDSLGGNSKTIMIANIGPASSNYDETIITLRYAYRAKSIKNKPIKNEDIKDGKLLMLQEEIERLKTLIMQKSNGTEINGLATEEDDASSDSETENLEKERKLELGKLEVDELAKKLKALEKQMVHGGKDIVDSVNENELRLEQQRAEIADRKSEDYTENSKAVESTNACPIISLTSLQITSITNNVTATPQVPCGSEHVKEQRVDYTKNSRTVEGNASFTIPLLKVDGTETLQDPCGSGKVEAQKREIEMQQRIELEEETCTELKQVFASLQQQVDFKRDKLKRLNSKLQSVRQEIKDNHEVYLKDRQEIENANDEAAMNLRQSFLIIDNFVPSEERSRIISLAQFDEDCDNWVIKKDSIRILPSERPVAHNYRRPVSDYAVQQGQTQSKYRGENILDLKLDMPLRTTQDYIAPAICPQIKALVSDIIKKEMETSHITIRIPPHSVVGRSNTSKLEQEGKYKQALKSLVDVHSFKNPAAPRPVPPRSAKSSYQLKQT